MENPQQQPPEPPKTNLQELAGKSWNLELIISGAAVFFTLEVPQLLDSAFNFYLQEIRPENNTDSIALPTLAYSFFTIVARVLTLSFVVHFILRAYWVSLVGLHAVWPGGIRYNQIPNSTAETGAFFERKMGQIEPLIHRLDKLANQVFSFAFLISLMGLGIGTIYLFAFGTIHLFELFFSAAATEVFRLVLFAVFILFTSFLLIFNSLVKKEGWFKDQYGHLLGPLAWYFGKTMNPFFSRPTNYLLYVFGSNISHKKYFRVMALTGIAVMCGVFVIFFAQMERLKHLRLFTAHEMFGNGSARSELTKNNYDNLRAEGAMLPEISLPSEVISEKYLPVFVSFPRWLDQRSATTCPLPEPPEHLKKKSEKVKFLDSLRLDCHRQFFQILINDSLVEQPVDWVFQVKSGTKGLATFLPINRFLKVGKKNVLTVRIPSAARRDSLEKYGEAIFWYFPE